MNVNPTSNRVAVKRVKVEERSAGGIFIPGALKTEKPGEGVVVAVGPGRTTQEGDLIPMTVKLGDRVIFDALSGQDFKVQGESLVMLREDEILGILE